MKKEIVVTQDVKTNPTVNLGDIILMDGDTPYVLFRMDEDKLNLVNLENGNRWSNGEYVESMIGVKNYGIPLDELSDLLELYEDVRLPEKVTMTFEGVQ